MKVEPYCVHMLRITGQAYFNVCERVALMAAGSSGCPAGSREVELAARYSSAWCKVVVQGSFGAQQPQFLMLVCAAVFLAIHRRSRCAHQKYIYM